MLGTVVVVTGGKVVVVVTMGLRVVVVTGGSVVEVVEVVDVVLVVVEGGFVEEPVFSEGCSEVSVENPPLQAEMLRVKITE